MPLIPIPKREETDVSPRQIRTDEEIDDHIKEYWFVRDWKCPVCGAVIFGRCEECVYCRAKNSIHTPRPANHQLV